MKIYVASSWRNEEQPTIVKVLREAGHEVYDFKNPTEGNKGFSWKQTGFQVSSIGSPWTYKEYCKALSHPKAELGFRLDMNALITSQCTVLVLPAGVSAAMEFGYATGTGQFTIVYGCPREPDLMIKMASGPIVAPGDIGTLLEICNHKEQELRYKYGE